MTCGFGLYGVRLVVFESVLAYVQLSVETVVPTGNLEL